MFWTSWRAARRGCTLCAGFVAAAACSLEDRALQADMPALGSGGEGTMGGRGGAPDAGGAGGLSGAGGEAGSSTPPDGGTPEPRGPATCTGCLELIEEPISQTGDSAVFEFLFDETPLDLSNAVVTWRVQVVNDTPEAWADSAYMYIKSYAQNLPGPNDTFPPGYFTAETKLNDATFPPYTWMDLSMDLISVPPYSGGVNEFDKSRAQRIGLQLAAGSGFSGTHTIRVFVDGVTFQNVSGVTNKTFDADAEGFVLNTFEVPMNTRIEEHFSQP